MRVLVYERDLLWSTRLMNALKTLGHEPVLMPSEISVADAAIVNLGSSAEVSVLVPRLHAAGVRVIAHAGHKEKDLHALGEALGCDVLATNSEMANRLESVLAKVV